MKNKPVILKCCGNSSHDIVNTLKAWQMKIVLLKNSYKRFKNATMPDVVESDGKKYTIPTEWKKKQVN